MKKELLPGDYGVFLEKLKRQIRSSQIQAAVRVNREMILLYWKIGKEILLRQEREGWGAKVIERLAGDLQSVFPRMNGFSARNLLFMRAFAEAWRGDAIVKQLVSLIPWGHIVRILQMSKDRNEREWYVRKTIEFGWSRDVLVHQIESGFLRRQGRAITNFKRTLPSPQSELAQQTLKDPYTFDFLNLREKVEERELESRLVEHLKKFLLELGIGFAFVGSQYHLSVGGEDYYMDLLFYHLRLHCYVVVELKMKNFRPDFVGQMNFYLSAVDAQLRMEADAPSIGLILCKSRNRIVAEYSLRDTSKPIGVSAYQLTRALPQAFRKSLPTAHRLERAFGGKKKE